MNQEQSVIFHLGHLNRIINNRVNLLFQDAGYNMGIEQVPVLMTLHYQGQLSQQDLANILYRDKSSIQRTVVRLVRNQLVTVGSDRYDKRKNIISLTDYGKTLSTKLEQSINEVEYLLFDHLGQSARLRLISMINELAPKHNAAVWSY